MLHPGAAGAAPGIQESTFLFQFLASFTVSHLAVVLLSHAGCVQFVKLVEKAHVSVQHHLPLFLDVW